MPIRLPNNMALTHIGTAMHCYHLPVGDGYLTVGYLPNFAFTRSGGIRLYCQIRLDDDGYVHEKVERLNQRKRRT